MGWTWNDGTPSERADMVRSHFGPCLGNRAMLCDLFHLTADGLTHILAGDIWRPEYAHHRTATKEN